MAEFIKLILVFILVLTLIRRNVNIGLSMLIAAAVLGPLFGMGVLDIASTAFYSLVDFTTLSLLTALILILFLENVMRRTLILQRMVSSVTALAGDRRLALALLPAFIGLLPSAGGAIFSAPMVEEASKGLEITPERKSFINYWYRHLWEYILPVYPSVILISQIVNVPVDRIITTQFPLTIAAMVAGFPVAFKGIDTARASLASAEQRQHLVNLAIGLSPIVAVMVLVLGLKIEVWLALLAVIAALLALHKYTVEKMVVLAKEAFNVQIALLVVGIMVFKALLTQSGAVEAVPPFFSSIGVPFAVVIFALPFIVGLMTGIAIAPVAIALPIIAGFAPSGDADPRIFAFAFASALAGVMMSPTHMCFVLTVQHFKADFGKVLRMVVAPEAAIVLVGAAIYFVR